MILHVGLFNVGGVSPTLPAYDSPAPKLPAASQAILEQMNGVPELAAKAGFGRVIYELRQSMMVREVMDSLRTGVLAAGVDIGFGCQTFECMIPEDKLYLWKGYDRDHPSIAHEMLDAVKSGEDRHTYDVLARCRQRSDDGLILMNSEVLMQRIGNWPSLQYARPVADLLINCIDSVCADNGNVLWYYPVMEQSSATAMIRETTAQMRMLIGDPAEIERRDWGIGYAMRCRTAPSLNDAITEPDYAFCNHRAANAIAGYTTDQIRAIDERYGGRSVVSVASDKVVAVLQDMGA